MIRYVLAISLLFAACGIKFPPVDPEPTPTPVIAPTPEPSPTATPTPEPTPSPSPSPTATPTPTPEPPPSTPTPSPTPSLCYDGPWTCGPHISQPIKFWTEVEDAVQETIDTDPRFSDGMSLPEHTWALWATEVMFRLEERGFCASKLGTDRGDTPSKEEVAVWSPGRLVGGELQREHWDLVVGTGDKIGKAYMFLPTVCVPRR